MQIAVIRALRQQQIGPIVAWGPKLTLSMLEGQDLVDAILPDDGKPSPWAMAKTLRQHHALRSIHFPKSLRPALAAWLAGVPERIGVSESLAGPFNTHSLPFRKGEGTCHERHCKVLALRWPKIDALPFPALRSVAAVELPNQPYICLMPGASNQARTWSAENFRTLAQIIQANGFIVVVQGGPNEQELGALVAGVHGINACGANLQQAITWFSNATGAIGNDSGLGHLAAACGTPTVTLSGPMDPILFQPLGPRVKVLTRSDIPCKPCRYKICPIQSHPCLGKIDPELVWDTLVKLMFHTNPQGKPCGS